MAVLMNKEFLYSSVLECSTTTARVLFLTCEFTMFVKNDINKLENLQRRGARFITKDYKSREEGIMTKMLGNQETTPATDIL
jgi:hypothetical protein